MQELHWNEVGLYPLAIDQIKIEASQPHASGGQLCPIP